MRPCGTSQERASRASERLTDNVAFLSQNQQRTGFSVESFTGVEGGACARRSSGFFYGLVMPCRIFQWIGLTATDCT